MRLNYRPLGDFIHEVNRRDTTVSIDRLLGVSIKKKFIPSIANTIGTDMSTYKIIKKNQFAYGPVTSRNGDQISIAMLIEFDEAIVSQAYTTFEVKNINELLPEYLMMWFCRPEFDRYARFMSHGSAREIFGWEEMCNTLLPIPDIHKQKQVIKEYSATINQIRINELFIKRLEEAAASIYKRWFVDFDFPDTSGSPYKSSGGEMIFSTELDIDIPKNWTYISLAEVSEISAGGDKPKIFSLEKNDKCDIPIYSNSQQNEGLFGYTAAPTINKKSVTISARGGIGYTALRTVPFVPIVRLIVVTPKNEAELNFLFQYLQNLKYDDSGSAQSQLTIPDVAAYKLVMPDLNLLQKYQLLSNVFFKAIEIKKNQNIQLKELNQIVLSKLATIKN